MSFYYNDVTFSLLIAFYLRDGTFSTLISFYYRDGTFSTTTFYKITKIVREPWLAERRVCMRVCKHGCDVKMFCFSRASHASTNLKKVLSWKTWQVYFIYPFPRRLKLEKSLETSCVCCAYQLICIMTISTYTTGARAHFFTVQEPSWRVISALTPVV